MKSIRFIFFLLFLVVAAFSTRLVNVVSGVSSLTQAAFAEEKSDDEKMMADKMDPKMEKEAMMEKEGMIKFSEDSEDKMEDKMHAKEGGKMKGAMEVETPVWVEASDDNIDTTMIHMELVEDLARKKKNLGKREQNLMTREALLKAAEKELDRKFQELTQLRTEIETLLETQSEEEQARIASLVKVYEGMKAKDAARIFDTLDLDVLVAVLSQMSERRLSPILAGMNPERARTVTIVLAEQKQLPKLPQIQ